MNIQNEDNRVYEADNLNLIDYLRKIYHLMNKYFRQIMYHSAATLHPLYCDNDIPLFKYLIYRLRTILRKYKRVCSRVPRYIEEGESPVTDNIGHLIQLFGDLRSLDQCRRQLSEYNRIRSECLGGVDATVLKSIMIYVMLYSNATILFLSSKTRNDFFRFFKQGTEVYCISNDNILLEINLFFKRVQIIDLRTSNTDNLDTAKVKLFDEKDVDMGRKELVKCVKMKIFECYMNVNVKNNNDQYELTVDVVNKELMYVINFKKEKILSLWFVLNFLYPVDLKGVVFPKYCDIKALLLANSNNTVFSLFNSKFLFCAQLKGKKLRGMKAKRIILKDINKFNYAVVRRHQVLNDLFLSCFKNSFDNMNYKKMTLDTFLKIEVELVGPFSLFLFIFIKDIIVLQFDITSKLKIVVTEKSNTIAKKYPLVIQQCEQLINASKDIPVVVMFFIQKYQIILNNLKLIH